MGRFGNAASGNMHAVLGLAAHKAGRLAVYGDSNCLDSSHMRSACFRLLARLIAYVTTVRAPLAALRAALMLGEDAHSSGVLGSAGRSMAMLMPDCCRAPSPLRVACVPDAIPPHALSLGHLRCCPLARPVRH